MALKNGQILEGRYRVEALLGRGGMGAVYQATDLRFDAAVAIKENQVVTPESQKQFAREAGLLYRLHHPNLPRVIDHFSVPGQGQYLVMDYVAGEDLRQIGARRGALPQAEAVDWIGQVLDALEFLHSQGIIHRDVKPANVKITPQGQVFLVDFGLAKVYDPDQKTTVGARGITPGYAPPEQYGAGRTDARADIYSAGATLYSLLTGQAPTDSFECLTGQGRLVPPRQLNTAVSPEVEAAVLRAMALRPDDRFQTAAEFRTVLLRALDLPEPPAEPEVLAPTEVLAPPEPATAEASPDQLPSTALFRPTPGGLTPGEPSPDERHPPPSAAPPARRRRTLPGWFWPGAIAAVCLVVILGVALVAFLGPAGPEGGADTREPALSTTAPTQRPVATGLDSEPEPYPPPTLLHPPADGMPELRGELTFAWELPVPLRPGHAFQLLIWPAGQREHLPASEYWPDPEITLNLDDLPQLQQRGPGEYQWSVVVVDTESHEPISPEAEPGPFLYLSPQPLSGEPGPLPPAILVEPPPGAELGARAAFFWEWPHEPLAYEFFFDLRIWSLPESELPPEGRRSATMQTKEHGVEIELPDVPAIAEHGPGDYFWSVVVVIKPCPDCSPEIAGEWPEPRPFYYTGP
jgi:hypothetical protein